MVHTDVDASVREEASFALVFSAFSTSLATCAAAKKIHLLLLLKIHHANFTQKKNFECLL